MAAYPEQQSVVIPWAHQGHLTIVVMAAETPSILSSTKESGFAMHSYTLEGMSWRNLQLQHSTSIFAMGSPLFSPGTPPLLGVTAVGFIMEKGRSARDDGKTGTDFRASFRYTAPAEGAFDESWLLELWFLDVLRAGRSGVDVDVSSSGGGELGRLVEAAPALWPLG